jgi:hypothetical protein
MRFVATYLDKKYRNGGRSQKKELHELIFWGLILIEGKDQLRLVY